MATAPNRDAKGVHQREFGNGDAATGTCNALPSEAVCLNVAGACGMSSAKPNDEKGLQDGKLKG
jgi:hypothetical protein